MSGDRKPLPIPPDWIPVALAVLSVGVGAVGIVDLILGDLLGLIFIAFTMMTVAWAWSALMLNRRLREDRNRPEMLSELGQ